MRLDLIYERYGFFYGRGGGGGGLSLADVPVKIGSLRQFIHRTSVNSGQA